MAFQSRKKFCYFKENGITDIDYKDVKLLRRFVNDQGKIMPHHGQQCKNAPEGSSSHQTVPLNCPDALRCKR